MLTVKVWGEFACFTRPETKAERMSYPVMTPSAARGVLEAIFWRPEFRWDVRRIEVLRPIKWISLRRNEMGSRQSPESAMRGSPQFADLDRAQRNTLALRDVAYVVHATQTLHEHATEPIAKYRDMFRRRVERGQCFQQPYLGCREFTASFAPPTPNERPIPFDFDLGPMLLDIDFSEDEGGPLEFRKHGAGGGQLVKGLARPRFFRARLQGGTLDIPIDGGWA